MSELGWKIALLTLNVFFGLLVTFSILDYASSSCIEDSLNDIKLQIARHFGEHQSIGIKIDHNRERINRIEGQPAAQASQQ